MLTDLELRALRPTGRIYKVADQRGLYVAVTSAGAVSFRFDYRLNGRRETLVIGRYDPGLPARGARAADELSFGMSMRLAEARLLLEHARREVEQGVSPSRSKVEKRVEAADAMTFGKWAEKYFVEAKLAESTRAMRKSVYDRNLAAEFGRLKLEEITPSRLLMRCEKIKARGAAAPAVQARDIVLQVYRFVQARGLKVANPAEDIRPSAIATFKPRDRALTPGEIHVFFKALERTPTLPTLRLASQECRKQSEGTAEDERHAPTAHQKRFRAQVMQQQRYDARRNNKPKHDAGSKDAKSKPQAAFRDML
ncbi:hypothetical protein ABIE53_002475 [Burkholderia sp. OAS925]|nr:hypothetical protein [Paraburkholderia graminis]